MAATVRYWRIMGEKPNLKNPVNFSEKITWLKLFRYPNNEIYSRLADKYLVREFVKSRGHTHILNPLYGVFLTAQDIDFEVFPNRFAIKAVHGTDQHFICNDKKTADLSYIRNLAAGWLVAEFGRASVEPHYLRIVPKIVVEKNFANTEGNPPTEYKIFCFHGVPKAIQIIDDDAVKPTQVFFDLDWNELDFVQEQHYLSTPEKKARPQNLELLLQIASDLSAGFDFVRVDLYSQAQEVIFGELTFSPAAGSSSRLNEKAQTELGDYLKLDLNQRD